MVSPDLDHPRSGLGFGWPASQRLAVPVNKSNSTYSYSDPPDPLPPYPTLFISCEWLSFLVTQQRTMPAINVDRTPYGMYGFIVIILVLTLCRSALLSWAVQLFLAFKVLSWAYTAACGVLAPPRTAARRGSASKEPHTTAELKSWLFRNTHERLPADEQPHAFCICARLELLRPLVRPLSSSPVARSSPN